MIPKLLIKQENLILQNYIKNKVSQIFKNKKKKKKKLYLILNIIFLQTMKLISNKINLTFSANFLLVKKISNV